MALLQTPHDMHDISTDTPVNWLCGHSADTGAMTSVKLNEETVTTSADPDEGESCRLFCGCDYPRPPRHLVVLVSASQPPALVHLCSTTACAGANIASPSELGRIGRRSRPSAMRADCVERVDRGENPLEDRTPSPATGNVTSVLDDFVARHVRNEINHCAAPMNTKVRLTGS